MHDLVLVRPLLGAVELERPVPSHVIAVVGMDHLDPQIRVGDPRFGWVARDLLDLPADEERDGAFLVRVDVDDRGELLDQRLVSSLGVVERGVGVLALVQRGDDAEPHGRPVAARRDQTGLVVHPARRPVREEQPVLLVPRPRFLGGVLHDAATIVGMDPPDPLADADHHLGVRQPEHGFALRADVEVALVGMAERQHVRDGGHRLDNLPVEVVEDLRTGRRHPGTLGTSSLQGRPPGRRLTTTLRHGRMAERTKATVLKTVDGATHPWVRIPLLPRGMRCTQGTWTRPP